MAQDWSRQVLEQLDEAVERFTFPGLPNEYHAFAGMRLTAFRKREEWLLVFEVLGFSRRDLELQNTVTAFGNQLAHPGQQAALSVVRAPGAGRLFDEDERFRLDPSDFEVVLGGGRRRFKPTRAELRAAKLNEPMEPAAKVIRYLAAAVPEALFFSDAKLLALCGRKGKALKRLLRAEDWHIPDTLEDERPSELPSFISLAAALDSGDPGRYACPKRRFNTHWSNWD